MKLRTIDKDGVTYAEVQDGKPVYEDEAGKIIAFDAPGTAATIARLNGEARDHRLGKEAAEGKLKLFEGIADPVLARKALDTMKNLDDKKLIDAGEVERVKAETIKALEEKYAPTVKEVETLKGALYGEKIGGAFARSKFIADKAAVPADMMRAQFGSQFKIEDGKVAAYDQNGNKLYSKARPGEPADFEEALEILVDAYPHRDSILKGNSNGGGGTRQGVATSGGKRTISPAEFKEMSGKERADAFASGATMTD